jgi:hypothetical protein
MDHYPDISVNEREYRDALASSRLDSASAVAKAAAHETALRQEHATERSSSYQSFPSPSGHSSNPSVHRTDSSSSNVESSNVESSNVESSNVESSNVESSNVESDQCLEAEYARYTNAPPPYSEKEYEGKDEEEQTYMRMTDYSKEISRMMGRQLVSGMKMDKSEQGQGEEKAM